MSIESRRRYPTSTVSAYSEIDLLVFRDTRVILERDRTESSCRLKIPINHSVEYIHFLCKNDIFEYMSILLFFFFLRHLFLLTKRVFS